MEEKFFSYLAMNVSIDFLFLFLPSRYSCCVVVDRELELQHINNLKNKNRKRKRAQLDQGDNSEHVNGNLCSPIDL